MTMTGYVERGDIPGIVALIARGDEIHVDAIGMKAVGGKDPMRRDTIFRIASITKPITAAATMILIDEGKLRLDDSVERWLPELANRKVLNRIDSQLDDTVPAKRSIAVRDLLTSLLRFRQRHRNARGDGRGRAAGFVCTGAAGGACGPDGSTTAPIGALAPFVDFDEGLSGLSMQEFAGYRKPRVL